MDSVVEDDLQISYLIGSQKHRKVSYKEVNNSYFQFSDFMFFSWYSNPSRFEIALIRFFSNIFSIF